MNREELYQKFGPMLVEAIVLIIKDEINILRGKANLPERTNLQIMTAIGNKISSLEKYSWMENVEN